MQDCIKFGPQPIATDKLLQELHRVYTELGHTPSIRDMKKYGRFSHSTYRRRFGSWVNALRLAGYEPQLGGHPPSSPKHLIAEIQRVATLLGRPPRRRELTKYSMPAYQTYKKHFGSWNNAVRAAGYRPHPAQNPHVSDGEFLEELRRVANELGHSPTCTEFEREGQYCYVSYNNRFGSWHKALEAAGLGMPTSVLKCKDGHIAFSRLELSIDNWLYTHHIPHDKEVRVCDERYWRCDFVIGNLWIEIDGWPEELRHRCHYEKIQYYEEHHYNYVLVQSMSEFQQTLKQHGLFNLNAL